MRGDWPLRDHLLADTVRWPWHPLGAAESPLEFWALSWRRMPAPCQRAAPGKTHSAPTEHVQLS